MGTFVGFMVLGLYQQGDDCPLINQAQCAPGEYRIQDTDGNGIINNDDRVNLGNSQADYYRGFTSQMRHGPLSLDAFFN